MGPTNGGRFRRITRVLWVILVLNVSVSCAKVILGTVIGSVSVTADGLHSLLDGASNVVALVGIWLASQPVDAGHPYGHGKFETLTAVGIAALLLVSAFEIVAGAVRRLVNPMPFVPSGLSFALMIATLGVNLFVVWYERSAAKRLASDVLLADAMHTASDVIVTISVLAGMVAVRLGFPVADPIIAVVVAALIARTGFAIVKESANVLCDAAALDVKAIQEIVLSEPQVADCHDVRTRGKADDVKVDLHVTVPDDLTVAEAHELAHRLEDKVKSRLPEVSEVMTHIEPEQRP